MKKDYSYKMFDVSDGQKHYGRFDTLREAVSYASSLSHAFSKKKFYVKHDGQIVDILYGKKS